MATVGGYVLAWQLAASWIDNRLFLPAPGAIAAEALVMLGDGTLVTHVVASMARVLGGVALGASLGIALGVALALSRGVEEFTSFIVEVLRAISPIALIALFVLWFGLGDTSKILLIAFTGLFPMALATYHGMRHVDRSLGALFANLGASRLEVLTLYRIPNALPFVVNGVRIVMTVGWYVLLVSEMVGGANGLGFLILQSEQRFATEQMWVGMITIGVLGFAFDSVLARVEAQTRWLGVRGASTSGPRTDWRRGLLGLVVALLLWEVLVRAGLLSETAVAAPSQVVSALVGLVAGGALAQHIGASVGRLGQGLAISFSAGVVLGLLTGRFRQVDVLLQPLKGAIRNINPLALFPLAILTFGIGDGSKVFVIAYGTIFAVWLQTHVAVAGVPRQMRRLIRSLGGAWWEELRFAVIPAVVPSVLNAFRIATGFGLIAIVGAELVASRDGLGWLIRTSRSQFNVPEMFAGIATISCLGLLFNEVWRGVARAVSPAGRPAPGRRAGALERTGRADQERRSDDAAGS